jgi:hypothetical protein
MPTDQTLFFLGQLNLHRSSDPEAAHSENLVNDLLECTPYRKLSGAGKSS